MVDYAKPEWNRDALEYIELGKIESRLSSFTRMIRSGMNLDGRRLSTYEWILAIRGYSSELWTYRNWLMPYIKKMETMMTYNKKIQGDITSSRKALEKDMTKSDILLNEGQKWLNYKGVGLRKFSECFKLLEKIESTLMDFKIKLNLGLRMQPWKSEQEKTLERIDGATGIDWG